MLRQISKRRFDALAGYIRRPELVLAVQEFDWLATPDERVLGVLTCPKQKRWWDNARRFFKGT